MADPRNKSVNIDSTQTIQLAEAYPGVVSRWVIHVEDGPAGSGNWSVQPTSRGIADSDFTRLNASYYDIVTGAVATAALTAAGLIAIDASGQDVALAVTVTAGSVDVSIAGVEG